MYNTGYNIYNTGSIDQNITGSIGILQQEKSEIFGKENLHNIYQFELMIIILILISILIYKIVLIGKKF